MQILDSIWLHKPLIPKLKLSPANGFLMSYLGLVFVIHAVNKEHMATLMTMFVTYPEDNILVFQ